MSLTNVILSVLVDPFVVIYGVSESYANQLLSIVSWLDAIGSLVFGKLADMFDCYIHVCIFGSICSIIACASIIYEFNIIIGVIFIIPIEIGLISSLSILTFTLESHENDDINGNINKTDVSPIATGLTMSASWIAAVLMANGFAWIHDTFNSYEHSFYLLMAFSFLSLMGGIIMYIIKRQKENVLVKEGGGGEAEEEE